MKHLKFYALFAFVFLTASLSAQEKESKSEKVKIEEQDLPAAIQQDIIEVYESAILESAYRKGDDENLYYIILDNDGQTLKLTYTAEGEAIKSEESTEMENPALEEKK